MNKTHAHTCTPIRALTRTHTHTIGQYTLVQYDAHSSGSVHKRQYIPESVFSQRDRKSLPFTRVCTADRWNNFLHGLREITRFIKVVPSSYYARADCIINRQPHRHTGTWQKNRRPVVVTDDAARRWENGYMWVILLNIQLFLPSSPDVWNSLDGARPRCIEPRRRGQA